MNKPVVNLNNIKKSSEFQVVLDLGSFFEEKEKHKVTDIDINIYQDYILVELIIEYLEDTLHFGKGEKRALLFKLGFEKNFLEKKNFWKLLIEYAKENPGCSIHIINRTNNSIISLDEIKKQLTKKGDKMKLLKKLKTMFNR